MKTITVEIRSNFGTEAIYPACETSRKFAEMLGTKTLTRRAIGQIRDLGYTVEVKTPTL
jgi:hypothetical protein